MLDPLDLPVPLKMEKTLNCQLVVLSISMVSPVPWVPLVPLAQWVIWELVVNPEIKVPLDGPARRENQDLRDPRVLLVAWATLEQEEELERLETLDQRQRKRRSMIWQ